MGDRGNQPSSKGIRRPLEIHFLRFAIPCATANRTVRLCSLILLSKRQNLMKNFSSFEVLPNDFPLPAVRIA